MADRESLNTGTVPKKEVDTSLKQDTLDKTAPWKRLETQGTSPYGKAEPGITANADLIKHIKDISQI